MTDLPKILPAPSRPDVIPDNSKWLSGEGAGSWFSIKPYENFKYYITRFSPKGKVECEGFFKTEKAVNLNGDFDIGYPSHCMEITVVQDYESISLVRSSL